MSEGISSIRQLSQNDQSYWLNRCQCLLRPQFLFTEASQSKQPTSQPTTSSAFIYRKHISSELNYKKIHRKYHNKLKILVTSSQSAGEWIRFVYHIYGVILKQFNQSRARTRKSIHLICCDYHKLFKSTIEWFKVKTLWPSLVLVLHDNNDNLS